MIEFGIGVIVFILALIGIFIFVVVFGLVGLSILYYITYLINSLLKNLFAFFKKILDGIKGLCSR